MSEKPPEYVDDAAAAGGRESSNITKLSHIAIAVRDADALVDTFVNALGATKGGEELLDQGGLRVVFIHLGPVTIELLEPKRDDHTVAVFLETRGPGLHHVSLEVRDIEAQLAAAKAAGARLIDEAPRAGAHGTQVAFMHPKSFGGVLVELCQEQRQEGLHD